MYSAIEFAILLIVELLVGAAALGWAARAAGSPRGRFGPGLGAMLLIVVVSFALAALSLAVQPTNPWSMLGVNLALLALQIIVDLAIIRMAFRLSLKRSFAPFGALVGIVVAFGAVALLVVRPYIIEAFVMPTQSMSPTINVGDRFCVNKRLSPKRWDVIGYWVHDRETVVYCKRLVGLPGERLRIENGQLFINDQPQSAPPVVAGRFKAAPPSVITPRYQEGETIQLGPTEVFLIGDNLDRSGDSRVMGPSSLSDVIGVADLCYWPFDRIGLLR